MAEGPASDSQESLLEASEGPSAPLNEVSSGDRVPPASDASGGADPEPPPAEIDGAEVDPAEVGGAEQVPAALEETTPAEQVGACGHLQHSGVPQPWLNTLVSDLASVGLFSGIGTAMGILTPLVGPRDMLGPLVAGLGLWGVGVERGKARPPAATTCLLLSAFAAAVHVLGELQFFGPEILGLPLAARAALILVIGGFLPAIATRFDRGETAWRAAARNGPATGFPPLAASIVAWRPPTPIGWLLLLLLPLDWAARALSVAAILGYQLTASRLMPSACRYEPTCSRYGFRAYLKHTWIKATLLTAFRVLRCSPIGSGGYDPIPRPTPLLPGPLKTEDFTP